MPKLYADGQVSDATINSGTRSTPAVREAAEITARATVEATRETERRGRRALVWLSTAYAVTPIGSGVAQPTITTAGSAAGYASGDVLAALASLVSGGRFTLNGTTYTRRF